MTQTRSWKLLNSRLFLCASQVLLVPFDTGRSRDHKIRQLEHDCLYLFGTVRCNDLPVLALSCPVSQHRSGWCQCGWLCNLGSSYR